MTFQTSLYRTHEDSQYGHRERSGKFSSVEDAVRYALPYVDSRGRCAEISCINPEEFPGAVLTLHIDADSRGQDFSIKDFWMYPDPNYRGACPSHSFYGTVGDFLEQENDYEK